jgi:hypothetical protein
MDPRWGVDSWTASNHPVGGDFFFDIVARATRRTPAFWGRYLNPHEYGLTSTEIDFLRNRQCKILLVYNGPARSPLVGRGAHEAGRNSAAAACNAARGLGITGRHVRLYADLEGWHTDADWFRGWCEVMAESDYAGLGGIYGNARAAWSWPGSATAGAETAVDQRFSNLLADITAGRASKPLDLLFWSTRPCLAQNQHLPPPHRIVPPEFNPSPPPVTPFRFTRTVIWQYRMNVTGIAGGLIDLDLCTEQGFEGMA